MTKNAYNYLIRLRPLDYYFFGGEITFGDGKNEKYYAKTRPFPQQTTILGVLRHLGYNKVDIGESFDPDTLMREDNTFGYIKKLSPLFLMNNKEAYLPSPLGTEKAQPFDVSTAGQGVEHWNGENWEKAYQLLDYKAKDGWNQGLRSKDNEKITELDDVIKIFDKIGITKAKDGEAKTDGFYKQQMAKLQNGWKFAVLAKLDVELASQLPQTAIMPFGAEKALFHISLKKLNAEKSMESYFPNDMWQHSFPEKLDCILLLSDALVDKKIYDYCQFAITDTVDFRNIRTPKAVTEFARFFKHKKEKGTDTGDYLYKSGKYNLLKRGSLLYGNKEKIANCIDRPTYQAIGYNHYITLSSKK